MSAVSERRVFSAARKIRFGHADPAGIVYYPNYFDMFNGVVEDFFDEWIGVPFETLKAEHRLVTPLRHVECGFVGPSRIGDRLSLSMALVRVGRTSITLDIEGTVDDEPRVRARLVHVFVSTEDGRPLPPPQFIAERLRAFSVSALGEDFSPQIMPNTERL